MSKLKTYDVIMTPSDDGSWVLKSEADKYIKELKEQNHELCQTLHSMYSEEEMNYQKYKRCLAMAKLCRSVWAAAIFIPEKGGTDKQAALYMKWENRWLSLANKCKYKEAK